MMTLSTYGRPSSSSRKPAAVYAPVNMSICDWSTAKPSPQHTARPCCARPCTMKMKPLLTCKEGAHYNATRKVGTVTQSKVSSM